MHASYLALDLNLKYQKKLLHARKVTERKILYEIMRRREEECLLSWNVLGNGVFVRGKQRESDLLKAL
jgi:hypothetical protein